MRRALIMIVTFVGGLYFFVEFFLPKEWGIDQTLSTVTSITVSVSAMAVGVGVINLLKFHAGNVLRQRQRWINSLALIVSVAVMFTYEVLSFHYQDAEAIQTVHRVLFDQVYMAMDRTTFALLAFYIASAAYRAFRVKSFEASVMMMVSLVVMLGQIPLGQQLTAALGSTDPTWNAFLSSLRVEELRAWIMDVWNVGAQRGIMFAVMVGGVAFSLRIWLGLEKGSFFEQA